MHEDRLWRFDKALGNMSVGPERIGYLYLEIIERSWTRDSTASSSGTFDALNVDWEVYYLPSKGVASWPSEHSPKVDEGSVHGPTPEETDERLSAVLSDLEQGKFVLRGVRYDILWITAPGERAAAFEEIRALSRWPKRRPSRGK